MFDISSPYRSSSVGSVWFFIQFFTYLTVTFSLVHVSCEFLMMSYRTITFLDSGCHILLFPDYQTREKKDTVLTCFDLDKTIFSIYLTILYILF